MAIIINVNIGNVQLTILNGMSINISITSGTIWRDGKGNISKVGNTSIWRDGKGNISKVGNASIWRDGKGNISKIEGQVGDSRITLLIS